VRAVSLNQIASPERDIDAWLDAKSRDPLARTRQTYSDVLFRFLQRGGPLLAQLVTLNPTFVANRDVGGADADLIVNDCLLEIKTTVQSAIDTQWIRQLIGYVLLDYDDAHGITAGITAVGFYLPRHGVLRSWPLQECLAALTGDTAASLSSLRSEFRVVCCKVKTVK
jgi:hypothetical protein